MMNPSLAQCHLCIIKGLMVLIYILLDRCVHFVIFFFFFFLLSHQEDISKLRRKIEKAKKPAENIRNGDEILNEEINEYKVILCCPFVWRTRNSFVFKAFKDLFFSVLQARLTCPCCNSRVKDAVLTKCFHVFCFECVKTRYDTRQRKCPKCNAAFGANDFHRIYIG